MSESNAEIHRKSNSTSNSNMTAKDGVNHAPPPTTTTTANNATNASANVAANIPEEKFRMQQLEASRRENVLVMRLTAKEQEVQEYLAQLEELRAGLCSSNKRNTLLDPAVNAIFQRMKSELQQTKEKLFQSQQEFDAWKFTPDSSTGKRLMAKCRMLIQENEELGKITSVGRIAKLEGDIAVVKKLCEELKSSQKDIEAFLLEMDENMEGMQSTVMSLQRKITDLQEENRLLKERLAASASNRLETATGANPERAENVELETDDRPRDPDPERTAAPNEAEPMDAESDFDLDSVVDRMLTSVTENEPKILAGGPPPDEDCRAPDGEPAVRAQPIGVAIEDDKIRTA